MGGREARLRWARSSTASGTPFDVRPASARLFLQAFAVGGSALLRRLSHSGVTITERARCIGSHSVAPAAVALILAAAAAPPPAPAGAACVSDCVCMCVCACLRVVHMCVCPPADDDPQFKGLIFAERARLDSEPANLLRTFCVRGLRWTPACACARVASLCSCAHAAVRLLRVCVARAARCGRVGVPSALPMRTCRPQALQRQLPAGQGISKWQRLQG